MVNGRLVEHRGRAVGVVVCEFHRQLEDEVRVGRVGGAVNRRRPHRHVLVVGKGRDARRGLGHDVHELFLESAAYLVSHCAGWEVWWRKRHRATGDLPLSDRGVGAVASSVC